jgi:hypothetical protein
MEAPVSACLPGNTNETGAGRNHGDAAHPRIWVAPADVRCQHHLKAVPQGRCLRHTHTLQAPEPQRYHAGMQAGRRVVISGYTSQRPSQVSLQPTSLPMPTSRCILRSLTCSFCHRQIANVASPAAGVLYWRLP